MKKWLFAAVALLALPAALLAAGSVTELGFEEESLQNAFFSTLRGWPNAPSVPSALRSLPADQKVAAVRTLGAFAKAYFASAEFKKDYVKAWKESKPKMGFGLPKIDVQAIAGKAVDKALGSESKADANKLDKDPNAQLKKRLQAFLEVTADVDFQAKTAGTGSARRFADEENEAKPREWKMCFRAGPEVTAAAREFAEQWLAELP